MLDCVAYEINSQNPTQCKIYTEIRYSLNSFNTGLLLIRKGIKKNYFSFRLLYSIFFTSIVDKHLGICGNNDNLNSPHDECLYLLFEEAGCKKDSIHYYDLNFGRQISIYSAKVDMGLYFLYSVLNHKSKGVILYRSVCFGLTSPGSFNSLRSRKHIVTSDNEINSLHKKNHIADFNQFNNPMHGDCFKIESPTSNLIIYYFFEIWTRQVKVLTPNYDSLYNF